MFSQDSILSNVGGGGLVAKSCLTLAIPRTVACQAPCPRDSLGKNTGVGCPFLLQKIFPTQESNPGLLHCRQILYLLSYEGHFILSNKAEKRQLIYSCEKRNWKVEMR